MIAVNPQSCARMYLPSSAPPFPSSAAGRVGRACLPLRLPLQRSRRGSVLPHPPGAIHTPESQPPGAAKRLSPGCQTPVLRAVAILAQIYWICCYRRSLISMQLVISPRWLYP